jgi:DNA polymerase-3 subunit gamma/tau
VAAGPTNPAPAQPRAPAVAALDAAGVRRVWDEVLATVRRRSQRGWAVVREASVREVDGETLVLLFKHSFHANALNNSPAELVDALVQVLGGRWQVRAEIGGPDRQTPAVRPAGPPSTDPRPDAGPRPAARSAPAPSRPTNANQGPTVGSPPTAGLGTGAKPGATPGPGGGQPPVPSMRVGVRAADQSPGAIRDESVGDDWPTTATPGGEPAPEPVNGRSSAGSQEWPAAARPPAAGATWSDDEPPYDPEYDPPASDSRYPGFDPGDEPDDDGPARHVRETSEEQALRLLTEALGAERID